MDFVIDIVARTFHLTKDCVTEELKMEDVEVWDSLGHMELIADLESGFNVEFTGDEIVEMTSIAKIEEILRKKIK